MRRNQWVGIKENNSEKGCMAHKKIVHLWWIWVGSQVSYDSRNRIISFSMLYLVGCKDSFLVLTLFPRFWRTAEICYQAVLRSWLESVRALTKVGNRMFVSKILSQKLSLSRVCLWYIDSQGNILYIIFRIVSRSLNRVLQLLYYKKSTQVLSSSAMLFPAARLPVLTAKFAFLRAGSRAATAPLNNANLPAC